ncbi:MAG: hypothetical protein ABW203_00545 [Novosphingobium sp.]
MNRALKWTGVVLLPVLMLAAGCGQHGTKSPQESAAAAVSLPQDPEARAGSCYAARMAALSSTTGALDADAVSGAAQFLLIGASRDGIADPDRLKAIQAQSAAVEDQIREAGTAAAYESACAAAYPQTQPASFKGLPEESQDTRLMCMTLANATLQIYAASNAPDGPRVARVRALHERLDTQLMNELNAQGSINPAVLAGRAMHAVAKGAAMGPTTAVLDACADRYAP